MTAATPSTPTREIILPRPSRPPKRLYPVPMATSQRSAELQRRAYVTRSIGLPGPLKTMDLAGVRAWISDLPLQSTRAIITAAAAGLAVIVGIAITAALG